MLRRAMIEFSLRAAFGTAVRAQEGIPSYVESLFTETAEDCLEGQPLYFYGQFLEDLKRPERREQLYRLCHRYKRLHDELSGYTPKRLTREEYTEMVPYLEDLVVRASGHKGRLPLVLRFFSTEEELETLLEGTEYEQESEAIESGAAWFLPPNIGIVNENENTDALFPNIYAHENAHCVTHWTGLIRGVVNSLKRDYATRVPWDATRTEIELMEVFAHAFDEGMAQCYQEEAMKLLFKETGNFAPLKRAYRMINERLYCAFMYAIDESPACIWSDDGSGIITDDSINQHAFGAVVLKFLQDRHGEDVWKSFIDGHLDLITDF